MKPGAAIRFLSVSPPWLSAAERRQRALILMAEFLATSPGPEELLAFVEAYAEEQIRRAREETQT